MKFLSSLDPKDRKLLLWFVGIGLGLAVSQKLTAANGGRIEAQSEPGKGSMFTVYLPTQDG